MPEIKEQSNAYLAIERLQSASDQLTQLIKETSLVTSAGEKPSTVPQHEQIQINSAKDNQTIATTTLLPSAIVDMQCMLLRCSNLLNQVDLSTETTMEEHYKSCVAMSVELDNWWDKIQTPNGQVTDTPYLDKIAPIKNTLGESLGYAKLTQINPSENIKDPSSKENSILEKEKKTLLVKNFRQALRIYENSLRPTNSNHSPIHRNLVQTLNDIMSSASTESNDIMPRQLPSASTESTASSHNQSFLSELSPYEQTLLTFAQENLTIYDKNFKQYLQATEEDLPDPTCMNFLTVIFQSLFCEENKTARKQVTQDLQNELHSFAKKTQLHLSTQSNKQPRSDSPRSVVNSNPNI